ncbi:molybdopterin-dependent oxidoreductase [Reichenbachiella carrageenanivorans]|uniref:Molybdopterin-dependent oxidoreductase n=1 Tax=Reichenbachiella carrageenanivorans TaxID=2979869 RepID=A0ABY6CWQ1_9BACT|nr:molybdopterin cofactor-binding domain-containing protein [Reichenbachiella carrageenanivorans]UXX78346.1 molybdopterin-dependent oxidoreductase [Reichenbachiella carrageenanivorans]
MESTNQLSRRKFLKITGVTSSVLALGISSGFGLVKGEVQKYELDGLDATGLNDFIFIDQTGQVTLVNHRPEMGQGVYQSMPMLLAEELEVNMDDIQVIQAAGDKEKYAHQLVGGSNSVRKSWEPSRKMGAAARIMLIQAAATKWNIDPTQCYASKGTVYQKDTKHSFNYGELVADAALLEAPKNPPLKSSKDFKILGKPLPRKDTPLKTNGEAVFGLDLKIPNMAYASIERSPYFLGKVKSFNKEEIEAMPGVLHVVKSEMPVFSHTREGVAVVATDYYSALSARKKLKIEWDNSEFERINQEEIYTKFNAALIEDQGFTKLNEGDFVKDYSNTEKQLDAIYELPYESHATMEPMNGVAYVEGDKCTYWGSIQAPIWIKGAIANSLAIKPENVTTNVTFLGGGFGRRAFIDFPVEAALLSKAIGGKPVKVVWTREDDNTQGPFRTGCATRMQAGIKGGQLTSLKHHMAGQAIGFQWPGADKTKFPNNILEGITTQYDIANFQTKVSPVELNIPVIWWRSVYSSTNAFPHESFIDEVANELGEDPMQFRIDRLQKHPRFVKVLEKAAQESDWTESRANKGVAIAECFGSICAHVVEVARNTKGKLYVKKVTSVIDCGQTVNSDTIVAQTEGNVIMALGACKSEITFKDGRAVEQNFNTYKMMRIDETPEIDVHIMKNEEDPGGVGEPGLPPLAPALANAVFAESGQRIRKLPFDINKI